MPKPISMTTPPVTIGGKTLWMIRTPSRWIASPARPSTTPTASRAPVTVPSPPPAALIATTAPTNEALEPT
ncbi:hypothetical protein GCM10020219_076980 [Nonomuraea dietziae]